MNRVLYPTYDPMNFWQAEYEQALRQVFADAVNSPLESIFGRYDMTGIFQVCHVGRRGILTLICWENDSIPTRVQRC